MIVIRGVPAILMHIEAARRSPKTALEQAGEAADIASAAFAAGDHVGGIAAIATAAQLLKLARLQEEIRGYFSRPAPLREAGQQQARRRRKDPHP
jgi:hypothetical protein